MKCWYFFLIFLQLSSSLISQTWEKDIPDIGYFWLKSITSTKDSGCVITGSIRKGVGKSDGYLLKCDKERNIEWFKTYGTPDDESFQRPIQTYNSDYVILGEGNATYHYYWDSSYSTFFESILVRTNSQGNLLWSVSLPNDSRAFIELPDSTLLISGNTNDLKLALTNISASGTINWTKTYDVPTNGRVVDMVISPQKKIFILTEVYGGISGLMNINLNGNVNWSRSYIINSGWQQSKNFLFATSDGGVLCTGGSFIKMDSTGNIIWSNNYPTGYFHVQTAVETKDRGFICSSVVDNGTGYVWTWKSLIFKLDASGNIEWSNLLGANEIFNIAENETGYNIEGSFQGKIYFAKTDSMGYTGCELQQNYPLTKQNVNFTVSTQSVIVQNITQYDSTILLTQNSYPLEFENVCCNYKPAIYLDGYSDVCDGENTLLTAIGGPSFHWSTGENNDSIYVTPQGPSSYWVECQNTCGYIRDTIEIIPKAPPTFTVNFAEQINCFNDTIKLLIKGDADNYYSPAGNLIKLNDSIYSYFPPTSETIIIVGYKNYYYSATCRTYDTLFLTPGGVLPSIHANGAVLYSNYSNGNQWYLNGNAIAGATEDSLFLFISGNYQVKVTLETCSAFSESYNFISVEVSDIKSDKVSIYPNPLNDKLYISISQKSNVDYSVWIYDIAGKPVLFQKLKDENEVPISALKSGIYFYKIISEDIPASSGKLIIVR